MPTARSLIDLANEHVPIIAVCQWLGVPIEDTGHTRSRKTFCPFGAVYHSDGGAEPAMRVYPESNSAWCFRCSAYFAPVTMAAQAWDQDATTAATVLLDRVGYRPLSMAEQWAAVTDLTQTPDTTLLAEALKVYCQRVDPQWSDRQFQPDVAAQLARCLALLERVRTDVDAATWLAATKDAMTRFLTNHLTPQGHT